MRHIIIALVLALSTVGCMKVPTDLHVHVSENGCTSQGVCPWGGGEPRNFYDATQHQIVVAPGQSLKVWAHEACHAHQQVVVIDETGEDVAPVHQPSGTMLPDLHEWLVTSEAQAYAAVREAAGPPPWGDHGIALLEDFAEACGRYLTDRELDDTRRAFFAARDFK